MSEAGDRTVLRVKRWAIALAGVSLLAAACGSEPPVEAGASAEETAQRPAKLSRDAIRAQATAIFGRLPSEQPNPENPISEEKIKLGRMLFYDARLSKNHDVSCNSCHLLDRYGVDGQPTSSGHKGQRGDRNSPTVYNAALQIAQFWDGRAADVEAQAKGPVLNPVEMAMVSEEATVALLESIPGYRPLFNAAFGGDGDGGSGDEPVSYDNMARAIGAFERKLLTPSAFDAFLDGDKTALTDPELEGLQSFIETGCITCHAGPGVGGGMFRKLGLVKAYGTEDPGRFAVTGKVTDRNVFKVPSLRNVAQTAPYFHDGSIESLDEAIRIMAEHQLGVELSADRARLIKVFLGTLTGRIDPLYTAKPELPESGPDTPAPDPS